MEFTMQISVSDSLKPENGKNRRFDVFFRCSVLSNDFVP